MTKTLWSLGRFLDVVFAIMFFRIVEFLPSFQGAHWVQLPHGILRLLASQAKNLTRVVFGLIITIYYWFRKDALLRVLARSNGGVLTLLLQSVSLVIASLLGSS